MKAVALVGGGYSVREEWKNGLFDKLKKKDIEIWSLNFAYKCMPYLPDRQLFIDRYFFDENIDELQKLYDQGVPITCKRHGKFVNLKQLEQYNTTRLEKEYYGKNAIERGVIFTGNLGLTGYFSLSYAIAKGYTDIYLLGYDFGTQSIEHRDTHFYQAEVVEKNIRSRGVGKPQCYRKKQGLISPNHLRDWLVYNQHEDVNIFNVSLVSNITAFKKISYKDFYERLPERTEKENSGDT